MSVTGIGASVKRKEDIRFHHRQGPLHRRHQPAGPGLRLFLAFAALRTRDDRQDRRRRGVEDAGFRRHLHGR